MTASHMQFQQPIQTRPMGLHRHPIITNSFSFDAPASPPPVATVLPNIIKRPLTATLRPTKRCLFGKPEPGSVAKIYQEELERQRQSTIERFSFDVKTETFVQTDSTQQSTIVTSDKIENLEKLQEQQHLCDNRLNNNNNNEEMENPNKSRLLENSKITSEKNCDEARGNIKNITKACNNNNINDDKKECDFYSCNQQDNNDDDDTTDNLLINNNIKRSDAINIPIKDNNLRTPTKSFSPSSSSPSSSSLKSAKKSLSERTQPYYKQKQLTEIFPVKKFTHNLTEKPRPQNAILQNNQEETINIS